MMNRLLLSFALILLASALSAQPKLPDKFVLATNPIELTRAARATPYIEAVGRKAALFGHESGVFESWVFPLKLFHDARLSIQIEGQDAAVDFSALQPKTIIEITYTSEVELDVPLVAPQIGDRTTSLKVLDIASPASNTLAVKVEGLEGQSYSLRLRGGAILSKISGATAKGEKDGWRLIEVTMPAGDGWQTKTIELEFK